MATTKKIEVPSTFIVPDTIEGVMGLFTARGWERAAIVYAYTKPATKAEAGHKGGSKQEKLPASEIKFPCSFEEFASLQISGLRNADTVAFYRNQWVKGIEDGWAEMVGPGDTFDVPATKKFPVGVKLAEFSPEVVEAVTAAAEAAGVGAAKVADITNNPKAVAAAIKASPKVAEAATQALVEKAQENIDAFNAKHAGKTPAPKPEIDAAYVDVGGGVLGEAITALDVEIEKMERADWVKALLRVAKALDRNVEKGVKKFGYTSVPAEIARVQEIQAILNEAAFKFSDGFIAEGANVSGEVK